MGFITSPRSTTQNRPFEPEKKMRPLLFITPEMNKEVDVTPRTRRGILGAAKNPKSDYSEPVGLDQ